MDRLDESKENIQPLKRGRNLSTLSTALQAQTDVDLYHQLMKEREQFEILVRSYSGDDPLKTWYDYVQWVEQNFPKHGKEGNLKVLLENCLAQFKDSEQYSQDVRYIDLWTRYMSFADNPLEMYKQIHARGIGTFCAIFYQCWAEEFELANDMKRADQVYIEGMKRNAQPIGELKAAHNDFQVRVARGVLGQNPLTQREERYDERTALSTLRAHGKKLNVVDSTRVGNSIKHLTPGVLRPNSGIFPVEKRNKNGQIKISVFKDENSAFPDAIATTQVKPEMDIKKENINKENTLQPGRWNEGKFPKKSSSTMNGGFSNTTAIPSTSSFPVHADENITTPKVHCPDIVVSNILKVRKRVYEDEKSIPIAMFEPADPSKKAMYPKDKVYCGGSEFSLEELRAIIYEKRYDKKKHLRGKTPCNSEEKITESGHTHYLLHSKLESDDNYLNRGTVENKVSKDEGEFQVLFGNYEECERKENENKYVSPDMKKSIEEQINSIPVAIFETPDPSKVPMYRKNQVYCNGTEYSLEELRANQYQKRFSHNTRENEYVQSDTFKELPALNNTDMNSASDKFLCSNMKSKIKADTLCAKNDTNECIKKQCFVVYVENKEEINAKIKLNESLQGRQSEIVPKVKNVSANLPVLPKEPSYSGYLTATQLIKERKGSDEQFSDFPGTSENKECDQSLTVNTKAVLNDVKDMWGSSPTRFNYVEVSRTDFGGINLLKKDSNSSLQKANSLLKIFNDSAINEVYVCPAKNPNKCTSGNDKDEMLSKKGGHEETLFLRPQIVKNSDKRPDLEEAKTPGTVFNIYADSFVEDRFDVIRPCGIPFVPSPGMTSFQKGALEGTENKENFHSESSKKKLCFSTNKSGKGILQPSQDVYCVPLEKQLEDCRLEQETALSDETCCTEAFAKPLVSSTPMTQFRLKHHSPEEGQSENPDDHTIKFMNMGGGKLKADLDEMPLTNQEQHSSVYQHSLKIEVGTDSVNCSTVAAQLSTIYEMSDIKKSNSEESDFADLDREFRTLCGGIKQENASSYDKPIKYYYNSFRDRCLKNVNFPAERHRNHCVKEIGEWKYPSASGNIIVGNSNYVLGKVLSETDGNLLLKAISMSLCYIRTESISHLWENYIKEEIRLRLRDPSMVCNFITAEKIHIYSNVIVSVSSNYEGEISLQDVLMKKYSMSTTIDEALICDLACKMMNIIFHLHQCNIVHGNICTTSFLVRSIQESQEMGLFLTGFENAVDSSLLPQNLTFDATAKKLFLEINASKVSPYQIDYIGLADALHHVIFCKPLDIHNRHGKWNISTPLPSNFENDLWSMLFEDLLNSSDVDLLSHIRKFDNLLKSNFDRSSSRLLNDII